MYWSACLAFRISPKSGPLRVMNTLLDASRAITQDLPAEYLKQKPYWREVGWSVFKAADTGSAIDIRVATEVLVQAIESESWMERNGRDRRPQYRLADLLRSMEHDLRACIAVPLASAGRPPLRVIAGSRPTPTQSVGKEVKVSGHRRDQHAA